VNLEQLDLSDFPDHLGYLAKLPFRAHLDDLDAWDYMGIPDVLDLKENLDQ